MKLTVVVTAFLAVFTSCKKTETSATLAEGDDESEEQSPRDYLVQSIRDVAGFIIEAAPTSPVDDDVLDAVRTKLEVALNQILPPCDGKRVSKYCWYLGSPNQSCSQVCTLHGGYDAEGTMNFAGSNGTDAQCSAVLTALQVPNSNIGVPAIPAQQFGCVYQKNPDHSRGLRFRSATSPDARSTYLSRACACNR